MGLICAGTDVTVRCQFEQEVVNAEEEERRRIVADLHDGLGSLLVGIVLARMEFIISNIIRMHPLGLTRFDDLEDQEARREIKKLTRGYDDKTEYFVDHLARGIAKIAAPWHPHPVIVRMSDFKSNEWPGKDTAVSHPVRIHCVMVEAFLFCVMGLSDERGEVFRFVREGMDSAPHHELYEIVGAVFP